MPIEGLRDALGHRAKVGILVPATNTIVEPELAAMQPPGVTNHVSRMGASSATWSISTSTAGCSEDRLTWSRLSMCWLPASPT